MPLTIKPPHHHPPSEILATVVPDPTGAQEPHTTVTLTSPDFSHITPKVDPLSLAGDAHATSPNEPTDVDHPQTQPAIDAEQTFPSAIAPTSYISQPPSHPFSSDDSSDGLALKAAISSLQFQRRKAQEDIKSLDQIKSLALADPETFAKELAAGRWKEKRQAFGSAEDIADAQAPQTSPNEQHRNADAQQIPHIPGPQNIVRMPHINWDKYHVVGEALDSLHEQQQRWPGSLPFEQDRGREIAVTAPFSPFHDLLDGQRQHSRNSSDTSKKDSLTSSSLVATPTMLEHPYETRRSSGKHDQ